MATYNQVLTLRTARSYVHYASRNPVPADDCPVSEASTFIGPFLQYATPLSGRKVWTNESIATAALVETDGSVNRAYSALYNIIGTDGFRFMRNPGNGAPREAKPMREQYEECLKLLRRIAAKGHSATGMGKSTASGVASPPRQSVPVPSPTAQGYYKPEPWFMPEPTPEPEPTVEPEPMPVTQVDGDSPESLLQRLIDMRDYCESRNADNNPLDNVGLRPFVDGAALWRQGIPVDAIMYSLSMHYPQDARTALGIREVDVTDLDPTPREYSGTVPVVATDAVHPVLPYCMGVIRARKPLMLIGGKGTGKTTLAKSIADEMGLDYNSVSCNANLPMAVFYGRQKPLQGEVVESTFQRIVRDGGVFLFDEIDAMDANASLVINELLANRRFTNPVTGDVIPAHENFIPISACNTMGTGATKEFTGRERLDAATLDRWAAGRVKVQFDVELAKKLFWAEISR